jgi:hypothetical protein
VGSKLGVFVRELEGKGGEYEVEITTVLEIARAKEGRSKISFGEDTLSDSLSDC